METGEKVLNVSVNRNQRVGRLLKMNADDRKEIKIARSGDIVAVVGLKNIATGNTLCSIGNEILLESISFPDPVLSVALEAQSRSEQDKLGIALSKLLEEDPTLKSETDQESGQVVLAGM